jgi:hypothetical protein
LPYELGTSAAFDFAGFNGRALTDDVIDVMLTLATNTGLGDGVAPDKDRTRSEFSYFGKPYTSAGRAGVVRTRPRGQEGFRTARCARRCAAPNSYDNITRRSDVPDITQPSFVLSMFGAANVP